MDRRWEEQRSAEWVFHHDDEDQYQDGLHADDDHPHSNGNDHDGDHNGDNGDSDNDNEAAVNPAVLFATVGLHTVGLQAARAPVTAAAAARRSPVSVVAHTPGLHGLYDGARGWRRLDPAARFDGRGRGTAPSNPALTLLARAVPNVAAPVPARWAAHPTIHTVYRVLQTALDLDDSEILTRLHRRVVNACRSASEDWRLAAADLADVAVLVAVAQPARCRGVRVGR
ncbi:MAG: hypothetical protein M1826_007408 [Phylliscum demangeonii]|nr:MAG: hypothetical protein M1826_007408 [Phylliscum demangeonii]